MKKKLATVLAIVGVGAMVLTGCTDEPSGRDDQAAKSEAKFESRTPPDVTGDAEYNNYIKAQEEIYDDPSSILWCTAAFPTAGGPVFTVPIAGKLTSSSTSYYPNYDQKFSSGGSFTWSEENQSVDGMYHGSPGPYRYGFTPGGQYVDFTNLSVFCTTSLTAFQQETLSVSAVSTSDSVTEQAEQALRDGDPQKAQDIVDGAKNE